MDRDVAPIVSNLVPKIIRPKLDGYFISSHFGNTKLQAGSVKIHPQGMIEAQLNTLAPTFKTTLTDRGSFCVAHTCCSLAW